MTPSSAFDAIPGWKVKQLGIPNFFHPTLKKTINIYIHGKVGSGKTRYAKRKLKEALVRGYGIVVFDVASEYGDFPPQRLSLNKSLLTIELIQQLTGSQAQYNEFVLDYFQGRNPSEDIAEGQKKYYKRAIGIIQMFLGTGNDLIKILNEEFVCRIVPDPNWKVQQLIIALRQLILQSSEVDIPNGVIVVIEEMEAMNRIDRELLIPQTIFDGRKAGLHFCVVSHTPLNGMISEWHQAVERQFDCVIEMKNGSPYIEVGG